MRIKTLEFQTDVTLGVYQAVSAICDFVPDQQKLEIIEELVESFEHQEKFVPILQKWIGEQK